MGVAGGRWGNARSDSHVNLFSMKGFYKRAMLTEAGPNKAFYHRFSLHLLREFITRPSQNSIGCVKPKSKKNHALFSIVFSRQLPRAAGRVW